jgi:cation:H+ antiporter
MLTEALIILAGVIITLILAEVIIRNSIQLANHYGFSGTFIGLTVLSIGTSIPEIMTHIIGSIDILKNPAAINTFSGLVVGTNIGSDIFQQNFVLPFIGIIGVILVIRKNLLTEMGGLIAAAVLVWLFSLGGIISRLEGAILLIAYLAYMIYLKRSKISETYEAKNNLNRKEIILAFLLILICFVIMAFVADQVLNASTILIEFLPISASFFGVILLGIATALPELMTSLIAVLKGKKEMSAGILIGSNITNPLLGIGLGALISTYTIPNVVIYFDLPIKIGTAGLLYYFLFRNSKLNRWEAVVLILLFIVYLVLRQIYFPVDF